MAKNATVAVRFTGDVADLKKATGDAEREMESFGSRVGPKLKTALAGAGVLAAGALANAFLTGLDQEASAARIGASLGLSDEDAKRLGKTAGDIYTDGWGESFDGVASAIETVVSTLGDELDPEDVEAVTVKAIALADVFRLDVSEAVAAAGYMLENDLARDATHAFDIITTALQKLPTEMRGEALDAISEYGGAFDALGIDGEEAFALILEAGQETSVGIDKVGDSIKEFLTKATDGSTTSVEALEALGLPSEQIASDLLSGGDAAEDAFGRIVDGLLGIEDPALQAQAAVALFGAPIEDLSIDKVPAFLKALQAADGGLGDVEGAADDVTDAMDTNAAKVEAWKRKVQQSLVDFVANSVIPALEDFDENFGLTMELIGTYTIDAVDGVVVPALGRLRQGFQGPIDGALDLLGVLQEITGIGPTDVADAIGMNRSEYTLTAPRPPVSNPTPVGTGGRTGGGSTFQPRAMGGPAYAGQGYMVGERGVELFVPGMDGQIVPSNRVGGGSGPTYNITIHNPTGRTAEDSVRHELRRIELMHP